MEQAAAEVEAALITVEEAVVQAAVSAEVQESIKAGLVRTQMEGAVSAEVQESIKAGLEEAARLQAEKIELAAGVERARAELAQQLTAHDAAEVPAQELPQAGEQEEAALARWATEDDELERVVDMLYEIATKVEHALDGRMEIEEIAHVIEDAKAVATKLRVEDLEEEAAKLDQMIANMTALVATEDGDASIIGATQTDVLVNADKAAAASTGGLQNPQTNVATYSAIDLLRDRVEETLLSNFLSADLRNEGVLNKVEFGACVEKLPLELMPVHIQQLIIDGASADCLADGTIEYEEWVPLAFDLLIASNAVSVESHFPDEPSQIAAERVEAAVEAVCPEAQRSGLSNVQILSTSPTIDGTGPLAAPGDADSAIEGTAAAVTQLTAAAAAGDTVLHVASNDGFYPGIRAVVGTDDGPSEIVVVDHIGSLHLRAPLVHDYGADALVKALLDDVVPMKPSEQDAVIPAADNDAADETDQRLEQTQSNRDDARPPESPNESVPAVAPVGPAQLKEQLASAKSQLTNALIATAKHMKAERTKAAAEAIKMKDVLEAKQAALSMLATEKAKLETALKRAELSKATLEENLKMADLVTDKLETELDDTKSTNTNLEAKLSNVDANKLAKLAKVLRNNKLTNLEADLGKAELDKQTLEESLKQAELSAAKLKAELDSATAYNGVLEISSRKSDVIVQKLEADAKKSDANVEKLEEDLKRSNAIVEQLEADLKIANNGALASISPQADGIVEKLEAELKSANAHAEKLEADLRTTNAHVVELEAGTSSKGALENTSPQVDTVVEKLEADLKNSVSNVDKLEAAIKAADANVEKLEADLKKANAHAKKLEADPRTTNAGTTSKGASDNTSPQLNAVVEKLEADLKESVGIVERLEADVKRSDAIVKTLEEHVRIANTSVDKFNSTVASSGLPIMHNSSSMHQ